MDIQRTAEFWDEKHLTTVHLRAEWHFHPAVLERQRRILRANTPEEWFIRNYIGKPLDRALGVGVGLAGLELRMMAHGAVAHFDLYDVSQASLDLARQDARAPAIEDRARYICQDFHDAVLEPESYDLVTFIASLHHMDRPCPVKRECYRAGCCSPPNTSGPTASISVVPRIFCN